MKQKTEKHQRRLIKPKVCSLIKSMQLLQTDQENKIQTTNTGNERGDITIDSTDMKMIIRE